MILEHPLFAITFTLLIYKLMQTIQKKLKADFLNPLLFSAIIIILFLITFNIDFSVYNQGATLFTQLIAPATVALAIPLYKHQELLKNNLKTIATTVLLSTIGHALIIIALVLVLKFDIKMAASLLPKSVTTAIASDISHNLNGYINITIATVIITGIFGASAAPFFNKIFKITSKRAQGLALGSSAHAMGTSKAVELGEIQGTMSTLALILSGMLTVAIAPIAYQILQFIL